MRIKLQHFIFWTFLGLLTAVSVLAATVMILKPGPAGKIVMASGGSEGGFADISETYKADLAKYGINLELHPEIEGGSTIKALLSKYKSDFKTYDDKIIPVDAGFIKGGFASSLQSHLANDPAEGALRRQLLRRHMREDMRSVGRLFYEPLWVFTRADENIKSLRDLKGKVIVTGKLNSGTKRVTQLLLAANGITDKNATLSDIDFTEDGKGLTASKTDAPMDASAKVDGSTGDAKTGDTKTGDTKTGDAKAGDAKAGDAKAGDANKTDGGKSIPKDAAKEVSRIDAVMMFLPPESLKIQKLLRNPALKLMDFSAEADAYAIRFPALSKVVLRQGSVELNPDTPAADITLLASSVALVVRADIDPAVEQILAHAVIANPKSGTDVNGESILFYQAGQFPTDKDPELAVSQSVRQQYKSGEMPTLLRAASEFLARSGLPFWPAAFLYEHGSESALLAIPAGAILFPLSHYLSMFYRWGIRRRVLSRYRQLKAIESSIGDHPSAPQITEKLRQLDQIETAVSGISVPLPFADQLYDLRGHIDLVRRRLELMLPQQQQPAE